MSERHQLADNLREWLAGASLREIQTVLEALALELGARGLAQPAEQCTTSARRLAMLRLTPDS